VTEKREWQVILLLVCLATLLTGAGCLEILSGPAISYPILIPTEGPPLDNPYIYTYQFEDRDVCVSVNANASVYYGAVSAGKSAVLYENLTEEEWLPGYYRSFYAGTGQSEVYDSLTDEFRRVRTEMNLDDDEYCELISTFVQSVPYKTDNLLVMPRYPIETVVDGYGDCDDKSMLLAGLLAHENYNVSLLYFGEDNHMTCGIAADGYSYGNTGYALIESTNTSFIGVIKPVLADGTALCAEPDVLRVGNGTLTYGACDQTKALYDAAYSARDQTEATQPEIQREAAKLSGDLEEVDSLRTRMEVLLKDDRTSEYNRLVPAYNTLAETYNDEMISFNSGLDEFNRLVTKYNTILTHQYDRKGTYSMLTEGKI